LSKAGRRGETGEIGPRGKKGEKGERGAAAPTIVNWTIDRAEVGGTVDLVGKIRNRISTANRWQLSVAASPRRLAMPSHRFDQPSQPAAMGVVIGQ
jgi:hypothetical protein